VIRGKAYRRAAARRKFERVKFIVNHIWCDTDWKERDEWVRRHYDHWPVCSCYMCGNHRRYFNMVTRQEKLAFLNDQDFSGNEYINRYHTRSRFESYR
jgi:hypothetical protein